MEEKTPQIYPIEPTPHPERPLALIALVTIALGNVFSASVYALQAPGTGLTGRSAWLAFALAVIIGFINVLPYLLISGAISFRGGDFSTVKYGLGKAASGLFAWNFILMCIGTALSTAGLIGYINTLWPAVPGKLIAVTITVLIFLLNVAPIKAISKAQNIMFFLLCASSLVYIVYGLFHLNPDAFNFRSQNYFTGGTKGFISAATTFCVTTSFYVQVYALGSQSKNPRKHIPKAMLITAIVILFLYPLMTLVNANTLPWADTVGKPMAATAQKLLPGGLFIFFIICGPFLASTTTLNAGFLGLQKPFLAAVESGWLPKILAKPNKYGAPIGILLLLLAVGVVPVLLTDNVMVIANATVLVQSIIKLVPLAAAWRIPSKFPEYWNSGLFRKMPLPVYYILLAACTILQLLMSVSSIINLNGVQIGISIGLLAVFSIGGIIWYRVNSKKITNTIEYETMS